MKILLDECVPWPLYRVLSDHQCITAQQNGWGGVKNGELLRLAEGKFEVFITSDQKMSYQQNLAGRRLAIIELSTNKLRPILACADKIRMEVATIRPGEFRRIEIPESDA